MEFPELSFTNDSNYQAIAVNRFTFKDFIDGDNNYSEINSLAFPMHNGT
jgi:hypothetical protein